MSLVSSSIDVGIERSITHEKFAKTRPRGQRPPPISPRGLARTSKAKKQEPASNNYLYHGGSRPHHPQPLTELSRIRQSGDSLMKSQWIVLTTACFLLLVTGCSQHAGTSHLPPPEVEVTTVVQKDVPITQEWVANIDGFVNAQIQPQVSGYLIKQTYREGSFVKKGQSAFFEIDPKPKCRCNLSKHRDNCPRQKLNW